MIRKITPRNLPAAQRGSTMVEVMVSVVLFSVGVIGLMRVLGTAVQDTGSLQYRSTAATLADTAIGEMWVDRGNLPAYVTAGTAVPELPNGQRVVTVAGNVVTVTINWQAPGAAQPSSHRVTATIVGN
ncbi:MAG: prepilin-type N-terminal cleavage/methylation domain-containing protein [Steroidobacteraceae bacterium]